MSSGDVMRAMVERIEELEDELERVRGDTQDGDEPRSYTDLELRLDAAEKNVQYERDRYSELEEQAKKLRSELAEERRKEKHGKQLAEQVKLMEADLASTQAKLKAATEVALTFEQKCEHRVGKLGEFLCASWQKHEKSQARWAYVADDMCKLLGVRFKEIA